MAKIEINKDECLNCGLCEQTCPYDAIYMAEGLPVIIEDKCNLCGACVEICTAQAMLLRREESVKVDISAYRGIAIVAEQRDGHIHPVTHELLGKARELAEKLKVDVSVFLIGSGVSSKAGELIQRGADKVYVADAPQLEHCLDEIYTNIIVDLVHTHKPEIVLCGSTTMGRSLIPRVATKLQTGLTADCTGLDIDRANRTLLQTRPAFGGNIMATITCPARRPQMATVRPKVMKPIVPDASRSGEVIPYVVSEEKFQSKVQIRKVVREESEKVNLTDAEYVVAGGRGLGSKENFAMLGELAGLLNGAVGATRAAVEADWISHAHQIGQTGKTVRPKIYIACGISGQIQHVSGITSADVIIAINKDPQAPIFNVATYGIVGDLFEVVPILIKKIKEISEVSADIPS